MSDSQASAGPKRTWHLNKQTYGCHDYQLSRYGWNHWEFSDGCLGSGGRTLLTAWLRWRKWRREYNNAPLGTYAVTEDTQ